jgi:glycosyltransferase involved in cell wall biosynthesis
MIKKPKISVIVPVHNEEKLINAFIREVTVFCKKQKISYELILVENGSTDKTKDLILLQIRKNPNIKLITLQKPGYGQALKTGLLRASGNYLVVYNVDFWDPALFRLASDGLVGADIILGSKTLPASTDNRPFSRRLITFIFNTVVRHLFSYPGSDTHGIKVFRRNKILPILKKCRTTSGIFDTELMILASRNGLMIKEIPVKLKEVRPARFGLKRLFQTPPDLLRLISAVKIHLSETAFISTLIFAFIFIRSLNFSSSLNFSTDQALFSTQAQKIWQEKLVLLIGPTFSLNFDGRYAFQGSLIYYFQLIFLLLGNWNPVSASYIFMLFSAGMIIPLYSGSKKLLGTPKANLISIAYCLVPFYINYTKFLWNPNFQFSLFPILIYLLGKYRQTNSKLWLLSTAFFSGLVLQFHYQFLVILFPLFTYLLFISRKKINDFIILASGLMFGVFNLILFELRHDFYNIRTLFLFFQLRSGLDAHPFTAPSDYYFLSLSLALVVVFLAAVKIRKSPALILFIVLFILDLFIYVPKPAGGFRMSAHWSFLDERKVARIISSQKLPGYNVANLIYDPKAAVQKYLLSRYSAAQPQSTYIGNRYLFVLADNRELAKTQSFEVRSHVPHSLISVWKIDEYYNLYLFDSQ